MPRLFCPMDVHPKFFLVVHRSNMGIQKTYIDVSKRTGVFKLFLTHLYNLKINLNTCIYLFFFYVWYFIIYSKAILWFVLMIILLILLHILLNGDVSFFRVSFWADFGSLDVFFSFLWICGCSFDPSTGVWVYF